MINIKFKCHTSVLKRYYVGDYYTESFAFVVRRSIIGRKITLLTFIIAFSEQKTNSE